MKLQVLGSAAAEGWPAMFCECDLCRKAWKQRGKDVRRRTSYLVNDDLLIDYGPDAYWQSVEFGIDLSRLDAILFTHSHEDHCNPTDLLWRKRGFSAVTRNLDIYGDRMAMGKIEAGLTGHDWDMHRLTPHDVHPGETFTAGNYTVTAIQANHCGYPEVPLNYIIQDHTGTTLLIGNDSGIWCDESWETLKQFKLDIAVIEATMGVKYLNHRNGHLSVDTAVEVRDTLRMQGSLKQDAVVCVNHFSHNGGWDHAAMEAYFNPKGIRVCYDGMTLDR